MNSQGSICTFVVDQMHTNVLHSGLSVQMVALTLLYLAGFLVCKVGATMGKL